jgi:hypothetical protein
MKPHYHGILREKGRGEQILVLEGREGIIRFLKKHLFAKTSDDQTEIGIAEFDTGRVIFHSIGGVDLDSELQHHGISLPDLYQEIKAEIRKRVQEDSGTEKPEWEEYFDSIGLSEAEIQMRAAAKKNARAARTVRDVAKLIEGTYFDADFESEDGTRMWGYFDEHDFTVEPLRNDGTGWSAGSSEKRVRLDPDARVTYTESGEDVHGFILLDPPE